MGYEANKVCVLLCPHYSRNIRPPDVCFPRTADLALEVLVQEDVPGRQVPVHEGFLREVGHASCNLPCKPQKQVLHFALVPGAIKADGHVVTIGTGNGDAGCELTPTPASSSSSSSLRLASAPK